MTWLLDTHTFIWSILGTDQLSDKVKKILSGKQNTISVSTISFWEISLKVRMKKYSFEGLDITKMPEHANRLGFEIITLAPGEATTFFDLPTKKDHKDPFDRMLIWQAIQRNMVMMSRDACFELYKEDGLKLVW
jgi:PIN domain nuclease of toxin-antitoxin system